MLTLIILTAVVSSVFWYLSNSRDSKMIWLVVLAAAIAMLCFILLGPML